MAVVVCEFTDSRKKGFAAIYGSKHGPTHRVRMEARSRRRRKQTTTKMNLQNLLTAFSWKHPETPPITCLLSVGGRPLPSDCVPHQGCGPKANPTPLR